MKNFWKKTLESMAASPTRIRAASSVLAVVFGLVVALIVMLFINPVQAVPALGTMVTGPFQEGLYSMGEMLRRSAPIILTGLSVAFAFRTGLFNIGATGQMTMGAVTALYIGVNWTFLGSFHWVVALLGALVAGALWGAIPGILKAFRNIHEVVTSIMLNYVAMYFAALVLNNWLFDYQASRAMLPARTAQLPILFLQDIFPRSSINIGIFIAILIVAVIHIVLKRTTFGYELKATGYSKDAARYAGMNEKRNIVLSMMIAGAIAGIAGAIMFLVPRRRMPTEHVLFEEGFTGIAIALLGLSAPIGVFVAGIFYGSLIQGGTYLQLYDFRPEIIDITVAVIIYFSALSLFLQSLIRAFLKKRIEKEIETGGEVELK